VGATIPKMAAAAGIGGALVYFLDPDRGNARRTKLKDQALAIFRQGRREVSRKAKYQAGHVKGIAHKAAHPLGSAPADDRALADRIRSEVFGRLEGPERPTVDVVDGRVTLRGEAAPDMIAEIERKVGKVPGVKEVVNFLHTPGSEAPNKADARATSSS
jgi:osmotically-inducible protein OsmY